MAVTAAQQTERHFYTGQNRFLLTDQFASYIQFQQVCGYPILVAGGSDKADGIFSHLHRCNGFGKEESVRSTCMGNRVIDIYLQVGHIVGAHQKKMAAQFTGQLHLPHPGVLYGKELKLMGLRDGSRTHQHTKKP